MENAAKGEQEIFLCFITLGGREGKASGSKKKKRRKKSQWKRPPVSVTFAFSPILNSAIWNKREGEREDSEATGPGRPWRARQITLFHQQLN